MNSKRLRFIAASGFVVFFCCPAITQAQAVAPPLGTAQQFGVLGAAAVTGATGSGVVVNGDVGSSPTPSISNFLPSRTASPFIVHTTNDAIVQQGQVDARTAYDALMIQGGTVLPDNLATVGPLVSGVYSFASGAPILPASTTLTLNGNGIFIFNVGSSLTANVFSSIAGTANPCNIYWRIGASATLNGANFWGTVIANTSITIGEGANLTGRAVAQTGAVTMAGNGGNTVGGCSVAVAPPLCPTISVTAPTAVGMVGVAYSQALTASGGTGAYTFSLVSGSLPPGVTLSPAGQLTGTPTAAGSSTVTIRATDGSGCPGLITYTIVVAGASCPVITLAPASVPAGTVGVAYSAQITASGGAGAYTFTVLNGTLPAGLTLSSGGVLSGTPAATGNTTVTLRATDGNGCPGVITVTINVAGGADSTTCPAATTTLPTITAISNQVIPAVPARGSVAVAFTIGGAVITDALSVRATSSDTTLVPASAMTITNGSGGARTLTVFGADGRSGVATITVTVTDPTVAACTAATSTSFQVTIGAVAVPTLPQWTTIALFTLLAGAGVTAVRRRTD